MRDTKNNSTVLFGLIQTIGLNIQLMYSTVIWHEKYYFYEMFLFDFDTFTEHNVKLLVSIFSIASIL